MLSEIAAAANPPTTEEVKATSPEAPTVEGQSPATAEHDDDHEGGKREDPVVAVGAVTRLRAERRQWEAEAKAKDAQLQQFMQIQAQRDQEWQVAQQRMQQVLEAQTRRPPPDKEQDPIGYMAHQADQTQAEIQALRRQQWERDQANWQAQQRYAQESQQTAAVQQFVQRVTGSEEQFRAQHPDYQDALTFAVNRRTKELSAAGWEEDQARGIAVNDARNMAAQWVQRGQDPASMAYAMAQAMGYQPKAADAERMHDEGYKASKPSGGGSGRGKYSVRQIANMTPSQLARMSDDDFKAAMGG
jgi:hypothetical protein